MGLTKTIPLRRRDGSVVAHAIIDADSDLDQFRWHLSPRGYAQRSIRVGGRKRNVYLHREVLGLALGDGLEGDHWNGDKLDNRRANLRAHTQSSRPAQQNVSSHRDARSRFRGVSRCSTANKWRARARVNGRDVFIGNFDTEEQAAQAAEDFRRTHMPHTNERR